MAQISSSNLHQHNGYRANSAPLRIAQPPETCTPQLDLILADPIRLHLACLLVVDQWCWLGYLRQVTGMHSARLNRHLRMLQDANYAISTKGANSKTWFRLTDWGEQRIDRHLGSLDEMVTAARAFTARLRTESPDWFERVATR